MNTYFCHSQEGVIAPLGTSRYDAISGTYIKDLNNVFNPYVGTWVGTWDCKELRLKIVKFTKSLSISVTGHYFYEDRLIVFYRITDLATGDFIEDNLDETDISLSKFRSLSRPKNHKFEFNFFDNTVGHCGKCTGITFKGDPATNQLLYYSSTEGWFDWRNCNYGSIEEVPDILPITTPATPIALTRL